MVVTKSFLNFSSELSCFLTQILTGFFNCFWILFTRAAVRPCSIKTTFIFRPNYFVPAFTATWGTNLLRAVGFCMVFPFLYSIHFLQYIIQKSNIPDAASQNINFGELFVRWVGRQKFSQFRKSHVDILLSPALPFGYGKHILFNAEGPCCQHVVFDIRSPDIKTWNRNCRTPWKTSRAFKLVCFGEFLGSNDAIHRYNTSLGWFVLFVIVYDGIAFFNPIKVLSSYNNNILTPVNWLAARAVPQSWSKNETCNENYRCDLTDDCAKRDLIASWPSQNQWNLDFISSVFFCSEKGSPKRTISAIKICRRRLFWVKLSKRFSLQYMLNHMSSNRSLNEKIW